MNQHPDRKTYKGPDVGLPELELFGWMSTSSATYSQLRTHVHDNAFEICLIARGSVHWWVGDEVYRLKRGSIYVTMPNELHGGVDGVMHPCELYWFILPDPGRKPLPGLSLGQSNRLMEGLSAMNPRTFPSSTGLQSCFRQFHGELRVSDNMSVIAARGLLHQMLVHLLRDHEGTLGAPVDVRHSQEILRTMNWLTQHMGEDVSVADMAEVAGIGVSRFHERFLKEVKLTPSDYLAQIRIRRAQELLAKTTKSISSIGFDVGFSSSQYFATVFKKLVGMSPVKYRGIRMPFRAAAH